LVQRGIIFIGDRIKFRSLSIVNHQIELDVIEAVPQDPSCCPTHAVTKTYALRQGRLEAVGSAGEGGQSLSTLSGTVWTLVEMDGRPLEAGVKPPTLEFREGRVGGFSGCNRYQGGFKDSGTGSISMGQMAGTMMACPPAMMALEKNYMARLLKAKEYSFQAGGLVLSSGEGDQPSLLKFTGKPLEKQQK
jgi:heat shock protein HslJ